MELSLKATMDLGLGLRPTGYGIRPNTLIPERTSLEYFSYLAVSLGLSQNFYIRPNSLGLSTVIHAYKNAHKMHINAYKSRKVQTYILV